MYTYGMSRVIPMICETGCENKMKSNIHLCLQDWFWKYLLSCHSYRLIQNERTSGN